eukprot:TRINITY_DN26464_c0_g1_i1.p1 TRINITY_DN26464_c0_g1~~TRINITY_DN26464_c0_g1_i1.p1  ORF type:complete len:712 (-),score=107.19 TRINITY_DN26464_c0_g1_i1:290-2392(-)
MAAGSGAAAAVHLHGDGDDTAEAKDKKPVPPAAPKTNRPNVGAKYHVKDTMAEALLNMWVETFKKCAGEYAKGISKNDFLECARLAVKFQRALEEVVGACVTTGMIEDSVRETLKENMFKLASNPQDPAYSSESAIDGGPMMETSSVQKLKPRKSKKHESAAMPLLAGFSEKGERAPLAFEMCKHLTGDPNQVYDLGNQVGEGTFGSVRKARHRQTGQIHAVKSVPKRLIQNGDLWAEIGIMKEMDHPHIMRLYYTFEDEMYVYMASEMCAGGELYDTLEQTGFFPEHAAAVLMRQVLSAVNYLHGSRHIAHRDLKPENFLVLKRTTTEMLHLKLIDFGTAKHFNKEPLKTKVCTAHYVAPEVLKRGDVEYTEKVDVWSCGVMLYMMLCGFMPFHSDDDSEILKIVKKGKYSFTPEAVWSHITAPAKDLIQKMMCVKVQDRCSASQAFNHDWVQSKQESGGIALAPAQCIVKSMGKFLTNNRLKRVALQVIARQISDDEIQKLRDVFTKIDADNSGTLTIEEIDDALVTLGVPKDKRSQMGAIMRRVDVDGSGELEYTEFLAAMLSPEQYLQEAVCKGAFCILDVDGDGELSKKDLQSLLHNENSYVESSEGISLSKAAMEEIETIMNEVDVNGDGGVSFEEFMALMQDEGPNANNTAVSLRWQRGAKESKLNVEAINMFVEGDADDDEHNIDVKNKQTV